MFLDGNWGAWSAYGVCSVTCGGGTQTHTRLCNNPTPANGGAACTGLASESVSCNTQICPISIMPKFVFHTGYNKTAFSDICICQPL